MSAPVLAVSARWVSGRALVPTRGLARAPDGSMVTAEPIGKHGGHLNLVRVTPGAAPTKLSIRAIGTPESRDPETIESTGEGVFALTAGTRFREYFHLLRVRGTGEVPGRTELNDDTADYASLTRLDHRRLVTVGQHPGKSRSVYQAATIDAGGAHWFGRPDTKSVLSLYLFNGIADETGRLVDSGRGQAWRYPSGVDRLDIRPEPGSPGVSFNGYVGSAAAGRGQTTAVTATGSGTLKVQTYAKDGTPNTTGPGDDVLAVVTPGQPQRVVPVPIPAELDASCLAGSLTDRHGVKLGQLWPGPDGEIWSMAGCAGAGAVNGRITHRWLVHWNRDTYAGAILPLPAGAPRIIGGERGFAGPNGVMYVATPGGTLAVSGLTPPAPQRPKLQRLRIVSGTRVRAEIRCVGTVGTACLGRVRFSDAGGALGTLRYGVDAGTAAMDPVVVRELTPRRAIRGTIRATLLS